MGGGAYGKAEQNNAVGGEYAGVINGQKVYHNPPFSYGYYNGADVLANPVGFFNYKGELVQKIDPLPLNARQQAAIQQGEEGQSNDISLSNNSGSRANNPNVDPSTGLPTGNSAGEIQARANYYSGKAAESQPNPYNPSGSSFGDQNSLKFVSGGKETPLYNKDQLTADQQTVSQQQQAADKENPYLQERGLTNDQQYKSIQDNIAYVARNLNDEGYKTGSKQYNMYLDNYVKGEYGVSDYTAKLNRKSYSLDINENVGVSDVSKPVSSSNIISSPSFGEKSNYAKTETNYFSLSKNGLVTTLLPSAYAEEESGKKLGSLLYPTNVQVNKNPIALNKGFPNGEDIYSTGIGSRGVGKEYQVFPESPEGKVILSIYDLQAQNRKANEAQSNSFWQITSPKVYAQSGIKDKAALEAGIGSVTRQEAMSGLSKVYGQQYVNELYNNPPKRSAGTPVFSGAYENPNYYTPRDIAQNISSIRKGTVEYLPDQPELKYFSQEEINARNTSVPRIIEENPNLAAYGLGSKDINNINTGKSKLSDYIPQDEKTGRLLSPEEYAYEGLSPYGLSKIVPANASFASNDLYPTETNTITVPKYGAGFIGGAGVVGSALVNTDNNIGENIIEAREANPKAYAGYSNNYLNKYIKEGDFTPDQLNRLNKTIDASNAEVLRYNANLAAAPKAYITNAGVSNLNDYVNKYAVQKGITGFELSYELNGQKVTKTYPKEKALGGIYEDLSSAYGTYGEAIKNPSYIALGSVAMPRTAEQSKQFADYYGFIRGTVNQAKANGSEVIYINDEKGSKLGTIPLSNKNAGALLDTTLQSYQNKGQKVTVSYDQPNKQFNDLETYLTGKSGGEKYNLGVFETAKNYGREGKSLITGEPPNEKFTPLGGYFSAVSNSAIKVLEPTGIPDYISKNLNKGQPLLERDLENKSPWDILSSGIGKTTERVIKEPAYSAGSVFADVAMISATGGFGAAYEAGLTKIGLPAARIARVGMAGEVGSTKITEAPVRQSSKSINPADYINAINAEKPTARIPSRKGFNEQTYTPFEYGGASSPKYVQPRVGYIKTPLGGIVESPEKLSQLKQGSSIREDSEAKVRASLYNITQDLLKPSRTTPRVFEKPLPEDLNPLGRRGNTPVKINTESDFTQIPRSNIVENTRIKNTNEVYSNTGEQLGGTFGDLSKPFGALKKGSAFDNTYNLDLFNQNVRNIKSQHGLGEGFKENLQREVKKRGTDNVYGYSKFEEPDVFSSEGSAKLDKKLSEINAQKESNIYTEFVRGQRKKFRGTSVNLGYGTGKLLGEGGTGSVFDFGGKGGKPENTSSRENKSPSLSTLLEEPKVRTKTTAKEGQFKEYPVELGEGKGFFEETGKKSKSSTKAEQETQKYINDLTGRKQKRNTSLMYDYEDVYYTKPKSKSGFGDVSGLWNIGFNEKLVTGQTQKQTPKEKEENKFTPFFGQEEVQVPKLTVKQGQPQMYETPTDVVPRLRLREQPIFGNPQEQIPRFGTPPPEKPVETGVPRSLFFRFPFGGGGEKPNKSEGRNKRLYEVFDVAIEPFGKTKGLLGDYFVSNTPDADYYYIDKGRGKKGLLDEYGI